MQYVKNSFKQVYWVFCKPLSFNRKYNALTEPNDNLPTRFKYTVQALAQSLLAIVILNVLVVSTIGWLYSYFAGDSFDWFEAALGVAYGVAGGVAGGVALGVAVGVALGVAFGVALGVALGVAGQNVI